MSFFFNSSGLNSVSDVTEGSDSCGTRFGAGQNLTGERGCMQGLEFRGMMKKTISLC